MTFICFLLNDNKLKIPLITRPIFSDFLLVFKCRKLSYIIYILYLNIENVMKDSVM